MNKRLVNSIVSLIIFGLVSYQLFQSTNGNLDLPYVILFIIFAFVLFTSIFNSTKKK